MKNRKWSLISGITMATGLLTVLGGALTDVYDWGNELPILIIGGVIFVTGGVLHQIKA